MLYARPSGHLALLRLAYARPSHGRARLPGSLPHCGTDRSDRRWQLRPVEVLLLAATMKFCASEGDQDDVWSMADDRLTQLARHLTGIGGTLSIAPMFAAADSERVHHGPSASALRDARQNSEKTRRVTPHVESISSATGPNREHLGEYRAVVSTLPILRRSTDVALVIGL